MTTLPGVIPAPTVVPEKQSWVGGLVQDIATLG
jgi:hypothetical protein